jgi:hypothetical protein
MLWAKTSPADSKVPVNANPDNIWPIRFMM